jgi:hypothetical protein
MALSNDCRVELREIKNAAKEIKLRVGARGFDHVTPEDIEDTLDLIIRMTDELRKG